MASNTTQPVFPLEFIAADRGPGLKAFLIFLIVFSSVVILLRFISRALSEAKVGGTSRFWWDDWLALAALVSLSSISPLVEKKIKANERAESL